MTDAGLTTAGRATRKEWSGLVLLVLPMLMVASDLTVLFMALPTVTADLDADASQALWIVHIYGFAIAGLLVTMGRLGDRIGPRRLMLTGGAAFAVFSVLAAFSVSAEMLIAARALMGVAGATLMPSLYSLLRTMFVDDTQRRLAIAVMFSAFSAGGAIGPLLGGALLESFWWGSVFLINVPFMVLLLLFGPRLLPERTERNTAPLDLTSVVLSTAGILAIVYGLQELAAGQKTGPAESGPVSGWSSAAIAVAGLLVVGMFLRRQRRRADPLLDLSLLTDRRVAVALTSVLLVGIAVVGMFFLVTQYLQWVVGLSPLRAGLWTVPYVVVNIAAFMVAPKLAAHLRPAVVVVLGLAISAAGAALLFLVTAFDAPLPLIVGSIAVVGGGHGVAMALVIDLIIASAPPEKTGSIAAAQQIGGELGTALGIAASGAVGMAIYRTSLTTAMPSDVPENAADAALSSVHGGVMTAESLTSDGPALLDAVHHALALGIQVYAAISLALLAVAGTLVAVVLGKQTPQ
jgi:DHA2 family multidrug resistance protein-like MFS transporter